MSIDVHMKLKPEPGSKLLRYRGDTVTFTLTSTRLLKGTALLRTNLGQGSISRQQIIASVEKNLPGLGRDWFDIPMTEVTSQQFNLRLPLTDIGHFKAKAMFIPEDRQDPIWIPGPNITINVEPADTCCGNVIYNAFVRQFGPNKEGGFFRQNHSDAVQLLDKAGYAAIPPSGTFRDLIRELDFIIGHLGCRFVQLLPIHPTPTTYGRMGRFGSPYAALSFTKVDPSLAEFDSTATPLEQFIELVQAIHARNAKLLMDIAINHTGWAASLHETHPEWLVRSSKGDIEVPGAWGVRWEDLTKLNYQHKDLWQYMANVFLIWCNRGVDGFRCDAGYMIPIQAWQYIIAVVREQFPDTIFFLEGLGGKIVVTRELLDAANFNWAYSELFQNYDRQDIAFQLLQGRDVSESEGLMAHYAETHDNPRLASRSHVWAKMRTALCALSSFQGTFGFANGVEWFATEKIDVHESPSLNWNAEVNQVDQIHRLSEVLKNHPAFHDQTRISVVDHVSEDIFILLRHHQPSGKKLMIVVNLNDSGPGKASWQGDENFGPPGSWLDLLTGEKVTPQMEGRTTALDLLPGQVLCITDDPDDWSMVQKDTKELFQVPERIVRQRLRAKVLEVFQVVNGFGDFGDRDLEDSVLKLQADPVAFCREANAQSPESRVIRWVWPRDGRREVMLPPGYFLLVESPEPFHVKVSHRRTILDLEKSMLSPKGFHWALLNPFPTPDEHLELTLQLSVYAADGYHREARCLLLLSAETPVINLCYPRKMLGESSLRTLVTNDLGAASFLPIAWGELNSRYDAVLSANVDTELPVDRWIMFTRLRGWVVYQDYSQSLNGDCLETFDLDGSLQGEWTFHVPTGRGTHVVIKIKAVLERDRDAVQLVFERCPAIRGQGRLPDAELIDIILRPDIENRSFHANTKAYQGLEQTWPSAVTSDEEGFTFRPDDLHILDIRQEKGAFVYEPEWHYMVNRSEDASRGFDAQGDLFSPGYFKVKVGGGGVTRLNATVTTPGEKHTSAGRQPMKSSAFMGRSNQDGMNSVMSIQKTLEAALGQFIVRRGSLHTVIAGYPWFLDWGRDAIIVTRALIELGETNLARRILKLFGRFEENGSLPNMLHGTRTSNRETSDAPLWFVIACKELVAKENNRSWLGEVCGQRTIQDIINAIATAYTKGTSNGIQMDAESGLIYSPSHYTWMDTNHPAGTPREGYPIEIQALWYGALRFLATIDSNDGRWSDLAEMVQSSIGEYFRLESGEYLSDCLHAGQGTPAREAKADDALRPNQLLAITMGAIVQPDMRRNLLEACQELLVPGAIRSLADRPVHRPLEIIHKGQHLGDPYQPYRGRYEGDEDTARKPAYHNGTAWTWLFPSFCEAWEMSFGPGARQTAKAWMSSVSRLLQQGCVGHVPEILDGDIPHHHRGCPAQAWGVSEALRVWLKLSK
jgi:starch synthase (maltosyl-transferring)